MPSFSQRQGLEPLEKAIQKNSMDNDLRTAIWNVLYDKVFRRQYTNIYEKKLNKLVEAIHIDLAKGRIDKVPIIVLKNQYDEYLYKMSAYIFAVKWNHVYDFTEFIYRNQEITPKPELKNKLNKALEKENSAYRIVGDEIAPIIDDTEIKAIEDALQSPQDSVRAHIKSALSLMADRDKPDFRNSIKESISAVEALCRKITGKEKATLPECLKVIDDIKPMHPAFKSGLDKLYGYTSDEGGIRHSLLEGDQEITKADARFMLVTCSSFVNYFRRDL